VALDLQLWYVLKTSIMITLSEDGRVSSPAYPPTLNLWLRVGPRKRLLTSKYKRQL
jgi:hypothetical protein